MAICKRLDLLRKNLGKKFVVFLDAIISLYSLYLLTVCQWKKITRRWKLDSQFVFVHYFRAANGISLYLFSLLSPRRKLWAKILGTTLLPKRAYACKAHFSPSAFNNPSKYSTYCFVYYPSFARVKHLLDYYIYIFFSILETSDRSTKYARLRRNALPSIRKELFVSDPLQWVHIWLGI